MGTKKFMVLGIALIMLFSLAACKAGDLEDYKAIKRTEIATYATSKGQTNYTTNNWSIVEAAVVNGKTSIDTADNKKQVDSAVMAVKEEINMVPKKLRGVPEFNGEPASPIWTAFTSDVSRLKVGEDLTIKLYYAPQSSYSKDTYDPAPISVTAKIIIRRGTYGNLDPYGESYSSTIIDEFILKEINNFIDEDNYPIANSGSIASEEIVIPAGWFVGERGAIAWMVTAELIWAEGTEIEPENQGGGVVLYYRIEDENIILYSTYYNFFNDIRN